MEAPVKTGQNIIVEITGYGHEGEGVGRHQGFTVFVPAALKGETVEVEIGEVRKNFARANVVKHHITAPERIAPVCPVYWDCGGCQLQHMSYPAQLEMKRQHVLDAMRRIGGLPNIEVRPVLGMEKPWSYRNKAQYPLGIQGDQAVIGFYQQGTHQIVPYINCLIQQQANHRIADMILQTIRKHQISIYNERDGSGLLRHVLIRTGFQTGDVMVVFVTNGREFEDGYAIADELRLKMAEVKSVMQNINLTRGNVILGRESVYLSGKDAIIDVVGGLKFKISAESFFQVNPIQTEVLYNQAVAYAGLDGGGTILDAYCGVGSLTLFLARQAEKVYGIEVVGEAIRNAKENAILNGIENVEFIVGETEQELPKLLKKKIRFDAAVVDPPRSGCEESVLRSFAKTKVPRIVYVSCNPGTLARDLKILNELGYKTAEIQPVDMFPQTYHIECVARIERR